MVEILFPQHALSSQPTSELLFPGEVVAVVDDSPEIVLLLSQYLKNQGFNVVHAGCAKDLYHLLATERIGLVLLDIGLPDQYGNEILKDIVPSNPDLGIIMVTGTTDIQVALDCLRQGADDYLTKPVSIKQFNHTVENTLKKRRLAINNRIYQQELQKTNSRMRFLHHLNLKMNTAYLNTVELQGILKAILVGITSEDGLRFNRAFLALYNESNTYLEGKLAIGPATREEAGRVWEDIKEKGLQLEDIIDAIQKKTIDDEGGVNSIIQNLRISTKEEDHVLIYASHNKSPIQVIQGVAEGCRVPEQLVNTLGERSFVVVPLYSPDRSLGVMIVDNFVTGAKITTEEINDLEIFTSQASIAIEHSHLYAAMAEQIAALEIVTEELEKSKDLLIEAERTSVIGEISAQLLHSIRNPLTSIGGTSRLLVKKIKDPYLSSFLEIITQEAGKIETILEDLFSFVQDKELAIEPHPLFSLIRKSVMIFYTTMKNSNIEYEFAFDGPGPTLYVDENKIRQVFVHLIRNSLEAMAGGGKLQVNAIDSTTTVTVVITDSGTGIPAETLPLVKNPFFTTKTYGNGMGLAIVEQILAAHGGSFLIQDGPEGGTRVSITLPKGLPSSHTT